MTSYGSTNILGASIESAEITDDTIEITDLAGDIWVKIAEEVLTGNVTGITFTGLDLNAYSCFKILIRAHNIKVGSNWLRMYVNNDKTNTNYYYQYLIASSNTVTGQRNNDAKIKSVNTQNQSTAIFLIMMRDIQGHIRCCSMGPRGDAASITLSSFDWITKNTAANVTQIDIDFDTANTMGTGSSIIIMGLK